MTELKIIDELEPDVTLEQVLNLSYENKIDDLIGHNIPESVIDYHKDAMAKHTVARRAKFNDDVLKDRLYFLLKSIDKSLFTAPEQAQYDKVIDRC